MADEGEILRVSSAVADMRAEPLAAASLDTQALFGEEVVIVGQLGAWIRGRSCLDGYEGWIPAADLHTRRVIPTHRVAARAALLFPRPDIKAPPLVRLPLGARVRVVEADIPMHGTGRPGVRLETGGYVIADHLTSLEEAEKDWVALAERCLGAPYLWGGRSSDGLDCSGLVQLAVQAAGRDCPRDTGPQSAWAVPFDADGGLARGDLVFWTGHVGIMLDETRLLHANAHHMAVAVEPLADAVARIAAAGGGEPTLYGRLPA